jgi:hypothetical protein
MRFNKAYAIVNVLDKYSLAEHYFKWCMILAVTSRSDQRKNEPDAFGKNTTSAPVANDTRSTVEFCVV